MRIKVRSVKIEDAEDIHRLKIMDGIRENTMGLKSQRISKSVDSITSLSSNDHFLVAELETEEDNIIVGCVVLKVKSTLRARHSGSIAIMVHKEHQGKKIGELLMSEILDIADNWLMLKRIELTVFCDNEKAINLYKKKNFVIEGKKKYSVIRSGRYEDEYYMARYNIVD